MPSTYRIIDTTLREGEQTPGLSFSFAEKMAIVGGLVKIGIAEIEAGIASPLAVGLGDFLDACRKAHAGLAISLWCRCRSEDIAWAAELGPDILSLSIPVSDLHLNQRLGKGRDWARRAMLAAIAEARSLGLRVAVGFEDASRAEPGFLVEMAGSAHRQGAERLRLADTVGICSPVEMARLVTLIKEEVPGCTLAVHTHNDFGMASANAVAALEAGAGWADATILGLGERSGCARLEELVGFLCLTNRNSSMAPEHLGRLADYVAKVAAVRIEPSRPVIGERIFTCETGLHLQGLQRDPRTYEPYPPERVGAERRLLFGAKSGRRAVGDCLARFGWRLNEAERHQHTLAMRAAGLRSGQSFTAEELLKLVGKVAELPG